MLGASRAGLRYTPQQVMSGWPESEIERWVRAGIISAEQGERIRALYAGLPAAPQEAEPARRSRVVVILSVLGAVFVAAGIVLFFAHNWTDIPRATKLLVIGATLCGTYFAADRFLFSARRSSQVIGTSLLLTGACVFGAAIFLIGQIYNLNAHWPNGLLAWWLGVLPLAYIFRSQAVFWLTLILAQSWFCSQFLASGSEQVWLGLLLALSLLYWSVAQAHQRLRPEFAGPLRAFALLEGLSVLLLRTWPTWGHFDTPRDGYVYSVLAAMTVAIGAGLSRSRDARFSRLELLTMAGLLVYSGLLVFQPLSSDAWARVVFNLILLAVIAAVLARGIRGSEPWMVNAAVTFIAFEAIARYIDAFWGYLARSAAFLVSGLLLLGGGWLLEKQRRFWLGMLRRQGAAR